MFKEVIVVEGRDDTRRLKEIYPDIETFETGGSALDQSKLDQIKYLQQVRGVIVFTDPDFPGQKIRQTIVASVPEAGHAYLNKADARASSGKGLGVEHASVSAIQAALAGAMTPVSTRVELITQAFLVKCELIGHEKSKQKRELLAYQLGIGYVNGKQLKNRLNMFGISEAQVLEALGLSN
ncbi:MAG: ribonuclease M5 [Defluviitaleaceae bacterium]|nr:ribonuclease M5 [Defluviitaleaceae bacterium]